MTLSCKNNKFLELTKFKMISKKRHKKILTINKIYLTRCKVQWQDINKIRMALRFIISLIINKFILKQDKKDVTMIFCKMIIKYKRYRKYLKRKMIKINLISGTANKENKSIKLLKNNRVCKIILAKNLKSKLKLNNKKIKIKLLKNKKKLSQLEIVVCAKNN